MWTIRVRHLLVTLLVAGVLLSSCYHVIDRRLLGVWNNPIRVVGTKKVGTSDHLNETAMSRPNVSQPSVADNATQILKNEASNSLKNVNKLRLELVHVPKTGGSTLSALAAAHGVPWGACHYLKELRKVSGRNVQCPTHTKPPPSPHNPMVDVSWWHMPLSTYPETPFWAVNASLFMVVRNPYSRIISQWNYDNPGGISKRNDAVFMNEKLSQILQQVYEAGQQRDNKTGWPLKPRQYFQWDGHYIPQTDYYFSDPENIQVLHQESLAEDFSQLAQRYGYNWSLPTKHTNPSKGQLTVKNLTSHTREWIVKLYSRDFSTFGYFLDQLP